MKVVILHDWLTGFRGGERVLEAFCEMFPHSPIYTLLHKPNSTSSFIESHTIKTSFLNSIPGIHENYRKFLPLFPLAVENMKIVENADLILSSSHCVIKGLRKNSSAKHISYVHSPMRYLYDQYDNYFGSNAPLYQRLGMKLFKNYLTQWDQDSNANVDFMIANSHFVKDRIRTFYGIDADVIHPFVDLIDFELIQKNLPAKKNYYLMVTAFAPNKRVDLAIHAFNKIGLNLKIIGSGQQEKWLKSIANSNIEFLGNLSRSDVIRYMAEAQAFIFPGVEDFGITPLEAMATGTPVIAFKAGGVLETLNEKTAIFFNQNDPQNLINAINNFAHTRFEKYDLFHQANAFSKDRFKENITKYIEDKII